MVGLEQGIIQPGQFKSTTTSGWMCSDTNQLQFSDVIVHPANDTIVILL